MIKKFSSPKMRNREFVFTPKIEYELVAERSEANQNSLTFPFWCRGWDLNPRPRGYDSSDVPPSARIGILTAALQCVGLRSDQLSPDVFAPWFCFERKVGIPTSSLVKL